MIVGNYYKMLAAYAFGGGAVNAKSAYGNDTSLYPSSPADLRLQMASNPLTKIGYAGVGFGTGDTAPTLDDYCLSGDLISTITGTYSAHAVINEDEYREQTVVYTITNTGSEEITIKEVCLFIRPQTTSSGSYTSFMVERTVLDTPVTIPADGIGQVTYTIRMNYPT